MSEDRRVKEGRFSRLSAYASLGARAGVRLLTKQGGAPLAAETAAVLGQMRGLATKVGQIASYVDGLIPEAHRETFEIQLASLRDKAASSPFEDVRALIEEELGAPLDELFVEFECEPFASASIGQVHRAKLVSGEEVAVKVQHPGIARAIESDLSNSAILEPLAALAGGKKLGSKAMFLEMKERLREELDYELEAKRQEFFRALHEGDPQIAVPRVIADRSGARVLTSSFARGRSLEAVAAEDDSSKRAFAETLWRFVFKGNLVGGMFNADPHPGNYLFGEAGQVTFLDYGCVEQIPEGRLALARGLHNAALRGDETGFADAAKQILMTRGGQWEKLAVDYSRRCFRPLFESPFTITRSYAASLVQTLKEMALRARTLPEGEFVPLPKGMLFMNRLQFGFYSVLARLDVSVDYRAVEQRFLEEARLIE